MNIGQVISGLVFVFGGVALILVAIFSKGAWPALIYGIPIFVLGIVILFYTKEDAIERIKGRKEK
ncbi:MAG: hypothetical protein KKB31_06530 [Nanoarchaeota archaeon]|nr:hypothetical protein [Nanoarchaeota archaeon]